MSGASSTSCRGARVMALACVTLAATALTAPAAELMVDPGIVYSRKVFIFPEPAVGGGAGVYLLAWKDYRNGDAIYAARVSQSGAILDSSGLLIADRLVLSRLLGEGLKVATDSTNWLVVWSDGRRGPSDIYGARVAPSGQVLDPGGFVICEASGIQEDPTVTFDGANYLICWTDRRKDYDGDIYGALVTPSGQVLQPDGFPLAAGPRSQSQPAVAYGRGNSLAVWVENEEVRGARVDRLGRLLDQGGLDIASNGETPAVASDGTDFLVLWTDMRTGRSAICGARVLQSGAILDPNGFLVLADSNSQMFPSASFDGFNYLLVWQETYASGDGFRIRGCRYSLGGHVLDPSGITVFAAATMFPIDFAPAIAFGTSDWLVAWGGWFDISARRVSRSGDVLDPENIIMSVGTNEQTCPAAAFDGVGYLAVWNDTDPRGPSVRAARITPSGTPLDARNVRVSRSGWFPGAPAVAAGAAGFLAAWSERGRRDSSAVLCARVDVHGSVVDTAGIRLIDGRGAIGRPALAFNGANFLAAWTADGAMYATRIDETGRILDPMPSRIAVTSWDPSVACDGRDFFVVWQAGDGEGGHNDILGLHVGADGQPAESTPLVLAAGDERNPVVCLGRQEYLLAWFHVEHDSFGGALNPHVYVARMDRTGKLLDPTGIPICTTDTRKEALAATFDGSDWVIAWSDEAPGGARTIRGERVARSGKVVEDLAVSNQPGPCNTPSLARGDGCNVLVTYSAWTYEYQGRRYYVPRVWANLCRFSGLEDGPPALPAQPALSVSPTIGRRFTVQVAAVSSLFTPHSLLIYDATGRIVETLRLPSSSRGLPSTVTWDASRVPAGVYFLRLGAHEGVAAQKVVVRGQR